MIRLLVLVPCRNETGVIERKLANLASCDWPATDRPHRVVVIDDHSSDGTAARAEEFGRALFPEAAERPRFSVVPNTVRSGKSGAITRGLAELDGEELIVLTDADVLFERRALTELALAFSDLRLGMACGAQRFAAVLPGDGREVDADQLEPAGGLYDRLSSLVRAFESAFGVLVSVHGQCLAWRSRLGLEPTAGLAADDLDLMLQARAAGVRVERVASARFVERKATAGAAREEQAVRRARAYVQFLRHPRIAELGRGGPLRAAQALGYRYLPTTMPWLLLAGAMVALQALFLVRGGTAAALAALTLVALLLTPVGRRLFDLMRVIVVATRRERVSGMSDVWETARR